MSRLARILMFVPGVFLTTWGISRLVEGNGATEQLVAGLGWLVVAIVIETTVGRSTQRVREFLEELEERKQVQQRVLATGTPGSAKVLRIRQTGRMQGRNPEVHFTLQVEHPQFGSYQAEVTTFVEMVAIPRVQPGQTLEVRVDSADRSRLALVL